MFCCLRVWSCNWNRFWLCVSMCMTDKHTCLFIQQKRWIVQSGCNKPIIFVTHIRKNTRSKLTLASFVSRILHAFSYFPSFTKTGFSIDSTFLTTFLPIVEIKSDYSKLLPEDDSSCEGGLSQWRLSVFTRKWQQWWLSQFGRKHFLPFLILIFRQLKMKLSKYILYNLVENK